MTVNEFFKADRYAALSGIELFEAEPGRAKTRMEIRDMHLHKRLATFEIRVTNEKGELIALFTATAYRKDVLLPFSNDTEKFAAQNFFFR